MRKSVVVRSLLFAIAVGPAAAGVLTAQDAAPADRNAVTARARPGDMRADSPIRFPAKGALRSRYPPDVKVVREKAEEGYFLFASPCRSVKQIDTIQAEMPPGRFTLPPQDWRGLTRTRRLLTEGGDLRLLAVGDSIVNDTMRSGWVAKLAEAYPQARIRATVYVRGGGGCQHYRDSDRVRKYVLPRKPDLVFIGGISQKSVQDIRAVVEQIRTDLPQVEILLATGTFGTTDPRSPQALAKARHSGTGDYGAALRALADELGCAYLDMTTPWAQYVRSSGSHPHVFYRDVVHANTYGEQILSKILLAYFTPASATRPGVDTAAGRSGFVSIFDGQSLKNWTVMPSKTVKAWSVRDGMIVGVGGEGRSYLVYDQRDIADFELKLSYRFPGKGNSGISIRARTDLSGKRAFQSYHADLGHLGIGKQVLGAWDFHTPGRKEHRCFRGDSLVIDEKDKPTITPVEDGLKEQDIKKNDWNDVHIIANGNKFQLFINGKLASQFTEHLKKERRLDRGMIQLQLHDPGMVVQFKDVRIRVLD